jgi:hypothetical protein
LSSNPVFHARTKHIEIDHHFVRERVALKALTVKFLSSKDQLADILTKPLVSTRFSFLRDNLTVCANPFRLRGSIESQDKAHMIPEILQPPDTHDPNNSADNITADKRSSRLQGKITAVNRKYGT